jgi:regulator of replication initiation timing
MRYLLLIFFISLFSNTFSEHGMRIRNLSLRFLISCKYKFYKTKVLELQQNLLNNINLTYDKSIHICNEYYQLSEEDRLFLETLLGIIF